MKWLDITKIEKVKNDNLNRIMMAHHSTAFDYANDPKFR